MGPWSEFREGVLAINQDFLKPKYHSWFQKLVLAYFCISACFCSYLHPRCCFELKAFIFFSKSRQNWCFWTRQNFSSIPWEFQFFTPQTFFEFFFPSSFVEKLFNFLMACPSYFSSDPRQNLFRYLSSFPWKFNLYHLGLFWHCGDFLVSCFGFRRCWWEHWRFTWKCFPPSICWKFSSLKHCLKDLKIFDATITAFCLLTGISFSYLHFILPPLHFSF